ncbi:coiled-coil domain-containing protein 191 isoform X2 [Nerophis lumbriciformis]|uniref:coiled-coil domain-containing protein 191 isoform X2 n=1 Tax=Nerophis lumbriciformis TaxID=546530 RepID=UPI002AE00BF1|nr:coiled-coil domain-containing protein 191-like isoform X2 [Nerophis lumbriciformis]
MATALAAQDPHLSRCTKAGKNGPTKTSEAKTRVKKDDLGLWRKRVGEASAFALSEVLLPNKGRSGGLAEALRSLEQWRDEDDTNTEAQLLLADWLDRTLQLELEGEEEDRMGGICTAPTPNLKYNNFDDLYTHLDQEEEHRAVSNFLHDLQEQEVLDARTMEQLTQDARHRKFNDPLVTMQVRHQQVREKRARRDAAGEEARRRERELEERRKRQEARRRQEEMVQQEIVRLRRQREERKGLELLLRRRERLEGQRTARSLQPALPSPTMHQDKKSPPGDTERRQEKRVAIFVHLGKLKCQRQHFSRWYSLVLERRLRAGKAKALCDWRWQLRAWRGWRAVAWTQRNQREALRAEEALRTENRRCQLAAESDRRRLLRRCLHEWRLRCRLERDKRDLLAQQRETRIKMDALICAATTGRFRSPNMLDALVEPHKHPTSRRSQQRQQVPRCRAQLDKRRPGPEEDLTRPEEDLTRPEEDLTWPEDLQGGHFQHRHAAQKKIILQQRKRLKEQQEEITQLKQDKVTSTWEDKSSRAPTQAAKPDSLQESAKKDVTRQTKHHPIITAMEERARARAERRKQIEEVQRVKQEEREAELQAAKEQKLREEEMEKVKKKEEKKLAIIEEEKRRQSRKQQQAVEHARQHYNTRLLGHRGLAPWKRLMELRQANSELAWTHHAAALLRRCVLAWMQSAADSQAQKEADAQQLHQRILLRRSFTCWKKLQDQRLLQEQKSDSFYRAHTLRRFLHALLDQVAQEKLLEQERQDMAKEHDTRAALWRAFQAWKRLPHVQRKEREREQRRERLGRKVIEVLPDFWSRPQ